MQLCSTGACARWFTARPAKSKVKVRIADVAHAFKHAAVRRVVAGGKLVSAKQAPRQQMCHGWHSVPKCMLLEVRNFGWTRIKAPYRYSDEIRPRMLVDNILWLAESPWERAGMIHE